MAFQVWGLVSLMAFYLVIFLIGMFAARRLRKKNCESESEDVMLAGRDLGLVVGMFSMTATWVDGGYLNGAAESVFTKGILWCQGPFGYSISLILSGLFFATKMREKGYVTMMDPFQEKYGNMVTALLYIPSILADLFCNAAILSALGATVGTIIDLDIHISIIVSGVIAIIYTLAGGMYSVTYTDVVELICIFVGLILCLPFCITNEHVGPLITKKTNFWGDIKKNEIGKFVDGYLLLILGGIPWQIYFQRVLSCRSAKCARIVSYVAGVWCIILAIPPVIIGVVAKATNWTETSYGHVPTTEREATLILPLCLLHLTPQIIAYIGLGAVAAAVMSSSDAAILSSSSQFARNIYKRILRNNKASEREIMWVMRAAMIVTGALATVISLTVDTIYGLWYLAGDLVYVILFPQLTCILYLKDHCNAIGAAVSFLVAIVLRILGGEPVLKLKAVLKFPYYDEEAGEQLFPFKTLLMLISMVTLIVVSKISNPIQQYFRPPRTVSNLSLVSSKDLEHESKSFQMTNKLYTDEEVVKNE